MPTVSKHGLGKAMTITLDVYRCGNAKTTTNLTISDPRSNPKLKTTLSVNGLQKLRRHLLAQYGKLVP
jgi:hypothetical protein